MLILTSVPINILLAHINILKEIIWKNCLFARPILQIILKDLSSRDIRYFSFKIYLKIGKTQLNFWKNCLNCLAKYYLWNFQVK